MKINLLPVAAEMRSDFKDSRQDTLSKMIQFGTVKYGIVKQLKDRPRASDKDASTDPDDEESCAPVYSTATSPGCAAGQGNLREDIRNFEVEAVPEERTYVEDHNCSNSNPMYAEQITSVINSDALSMIRGTYQQEVTQNDSKNCPVPRMDYAKSNELPSRSRQVSPEKHLADSNEVEHPLSETGTPHPSKEDDVRVICEVGPSFQNKDVETKQDGSEASNEGLRSPPEGQGMLGGSADTGNPNTPNTSIFALSAGAGSQFAAAPVNLDAIQNMQMAIAQFAAKTIADGSNASDHEAAMKHLAFLQQTLFNLQQQQLFQIQLIHQLHSRLAMNQAKGNEVSEDLDEEHEDGEEDTYEEEERIAEMELRLKVEARMAEAQARQHLLNAGVSVDKVKAPDSLKRKREEDSEFQASCRSNPTNVTGTEQMSSTPKTTEVLTMDPIAKMKEMENLPLPYVSDLASSIITNHDDLPAPNSLEMLQKRAQEVLDSASQGILANSMADEFTYKDKSGDGRGRNDQLFKHRCRYCGKVFGSDSALQIHIRSHTGERPFKCNVCGSRFTTKGNLKVHFQRHAHKFPHIPMNATPIPEHLDKFHPPLLDQMSPEDSPKHSPASMPQQISPVSMPIPIASFPSIYRPQMNIFKSLGTASRSPGFPSAFFPRISTISDGETAASEAVQGQIEAQEVVKREVDIPTDLRKSAEDNLQSFSQECEKMGEAQNIRSRSITTISPPNVQIKEEPIESPLREDGEQTASATSMSLRPPLGSEQPAKALEDAATSPSCVPPVVQPAQPSVIMHPKPPLGSQNHFDHLPTPGQLPPSMHHREDFFAERFPLNFTSALSPDHHSPIRSPANVPRSTFFNPLKHDIALLPRPHSNDNSWENFIEVSNTSETLKLKELMKNKKITDPNQCVVCDRVLSCKSALQMHYRTHTGERPFKCRICGRAFTTKGNLKTHMAVHKIRPPMRNFHQCPVCHKKYSNALVLQQHIRLHTGEPTDLTPEQIQAAEIRDHPPSIMPGTFMNPFAAAAFQFGPVAGSAGPLGPLGSHNNGTLGSESSQGDLDDNMDCSDEFEDDVSDRMSSCHENELPDRPKSSDDFKGMFFEQKLRINATGMVNNAPRPNSASSVSNSGTSGPASPIQMPKTGASPSSSPAPSTADTSHGALDLTPRAGPSTISSISSKSPASAACGKSQTPTPPLKSSSAISPNPGQQQLSELGSTSLAPSLHPAAMERFPTNLHLHLQQQHQHMMQQQVSIAAVAQAQHHHLQQHAAAMHQEQLRNDQHQHQHQHHQQQLQQLQQPQPQSQPLSPQQQTAPAPVADPPLPLVTTRPPFGMFPSLPLFPPPTAQSMCSAMNSIAQSVMPAAPFNPLALSGVRGSTTCGICFKTFPCHSALEIHYRSHTKERPFKCTICDRGFTTKGNLKQHMLTHKIRDMEQETFRNRAVKYMSGWKEEYE